MINDTLKREITGFVKEIMAKMERQNMLASRR
jgi:hypothetical protein